MEAFHHIVALMEVKGQTVLCLHALPQDQPHQLAAPMVEFHHSAVLTVVVGQIALFLLDPQ